MPKPRPRSQLHSKHKRSKGKPNQAIQWLNKIIQVPKIIKGKYIIIQYSCVIKTVGVSNYTKGDHAGSHHDTSLNIALHNA